MKGGSTICYVLIFSVVFNTQQSNAQNYPPWRMRGKFNPYAVPKRSERYCGDTYRNGDGVLTSPLYSRSYPGNTDCSWTLSATADKIITVSFVDFEMESSDKCEYDYLKIYDGENTESPLLGKFCGDTIPDKLSSSGSKLLVVFHSDASQQKRGFKMKYLVSYGCDRVFTAESGEIISPNHPGNHPGGITCLYRINATMGSTIQLEFVELNLETSGDKCAYDYIEIIDGPTEHFPRLGKFCGDNIPDVKLSTKNQIILRFVADASVESTGFRIKYYSKVATMNDICNRPAYTGDCRADIQRWFYNTATKNCETFSYGGCRSNGNNFRTKTECARQCKGKTDTDFNECSKKNGGCDQACHNTQGSYFCSCWKGYKIGNDKHTCKDINECSLGRNIHHCDHKCINIKGSYYCDCNSGFQLSANGRTCKDINECLFGGGGACQQECVNTPGSFKCLCFNGFEPFPGRSMRCRDINECEMDLPDCHKCFNLEGSYRCECKPGFELNINKTACLDINECLINNGGCSQSCINQPGNYTCQCKEGFTSKDPGNVNCEDIDECSSNSGRGKCEHHCTNYVGSFNCSCPEGFQLAENKLSCVDIDECQVNNGDCNYKCINTLSSHTCGCYDGYEEIGRNGSEITCQDIDECSVGSHECDTDLGSTCVNEIGNYSCTCPPGYYSDWKNCVDVDECNDPTINDCAQHCNNTPGSFHCECLKGFSINSDGKTCTDIDECASSPCSHICINGIGSFICLCNAGYRLDKDAKTCLDVNECEHENGFCQHICTNTNGSYNCQCREGYKALVGGIACSDINECTEGTACCDTECENEEGGYRCKCNEGHFLSRDNCTCQDTNECFVNNGGCEHICNNTKGGFGCSCHPGYQVDPTNSSRCLDINECSQNNGGCSQICNNTDGSYECHCRPVFKLAPDGKTCDHCPSCESYEELILLVEQLQMEVQSLKNWKATFGSKNNDCRFKGKSYKDSDNWEDGNCRRCFCEKGQVLCFQDKKCIQPVCPAPLNECPFAPEDTCVSDNQCSDQEKCCQHAKCRLTKVCSEALQRKL